MRKTRSQTQAENALLADESDVNILRINSCSGFNNQSANNSNISADNSRMQNSAARIELNIRSTAPTSTPLMYPNNLNDYEQLLQPLRVVELQQILSYVNIPFAGRKADLQRRVISLLHSNFELIAPKIEEVARLSVADHQASAAALNLTERNRMYSHLQMPHSVQANGGSLMTPNGPVSMPVNQHHQTQQQQQQQHMQQLAHNAAAAAAAAAAAGVAPVPQFMHPITAQIPTHPDVRLKKLAFYDILGTLIKPSSLMPRTTQRIQEGTFNFTLTPQQATEIATNRDIRNPSKVEHLIQVQLRFCMVETTCDQEDVFPPSVSVKVNNKLCQLPNIIPTNRPNAEQKRPPRPINITPHVKLSPILPNQIAVQWCPDYARSYCLAVYLVKKLTSAQLLHRMKTKGVKAADFTRALIKEKLTEDADCEIATTMLKVSLNCPLGKMKMSIPCRSSTCFHLQCFDANLYLQMNERKPTWNCPVCDKPAIYDNLVIDGYFQEVLASPLLKNDDTEIQLHKDGSWSTHTLRNETQVVDNNPSKTVEKVEVISDDIELITTEDVKPIKVAATPAVPNNQPTSTTSETVDLTLSDSDDDLPLAKRRSNRLILNGGMATSSTNAVSSASAVSSSGMNGVGGGGGGDSLRNYEI